jgi:hydroxyacylglutathione hydrolase
VLALLHDLMKSYNAAKPLVTTLALEREINTFFRLTNKTVINRLHDSFPKMPEEPTPREVFLRLRELRNHR